ncbi:MAG: nucleotidyltransferase domain-containing protein [Actinomycetota bacterium]|nr:nucleotidyltransferase domain-containing protein [Actinomycetota bacterium]
MTGFDRLLELAKDEASILGIVLTGSRGRGTARPDSDWDCYVIVSDDAPQESLAAVDSLRRRSLDSVVLRLSDYETYASPDSSNAWEAYAFAHVMVYHEALNSRIGEIAAAKEFLDPEVAQRRTREVLDAYINQSVRAAKSLRDGEEGAARLDQAEAVALALETIFALESRVRPYNRYLAWELECHPLSLPYDQDLPLTVKALADGDVVRAATLFRVIERCSRQSGWEEVLDAWKQQDLDLARSEQP